MEHIRIGREKAAPYYILLYFAFRPGISGRYYKLKEVIT